MNQTEASEVVKLQGYKTMSKWAKAVCSQKIHILTKIGLRGEYWTLVMHILPRARLRGFQGFAKIQVAEIDLSLGALQS